MSNNKKYQRLDEASLNFIEIAKGMGYSMDKAKSTRKIIVLASDSKRLSVYDNGEKGFYYINQRDNSERGSIVDLVKRDLNMSFIEAKDFILGVQGAPLIPTERKEAVEGKKDFTSAFLKSSFPITDNYLINERGIEKDLLEVSEEARRGTDTNLFFHRDQNGELTGYEYRSEGKKGFAKGGKKSLFTLTWCEKIETLVIVESAINAYSYISLLLLNDVPDNYLNAMVVSTAGRFSQSQKDQIKALADRHKPLIIFAQDNDLSGDGDKQAQELKEALEGHRTMRHRPKLNDFNDDLIRELTEE